MTEPVLPRIYYRIQLLQPFFFFLALASTHFYKSSFDVSSGLDALERMEEKETALLVTLG